MKEDRRLLKEVMRWAAEGRNRKGRPAGKWIDGLRRSRELKGLRDKHELERE